jgi:hypothetical protein
MDLFKTIYQAQAGARHGIDLEGRAYMPYLAVVTDNKDPQNRRRIKASDPAAPGLETDWIRRLLPYPQVDPPLPVIGSTVIVFSIDGDPLNGWYLECVNDTNPVLPKGDPIADFHNVIPGDTDERTDGDRTINVGKSLTLKNDAGASIELAASGDIVLTDSAGNSITLSGGISGISFNTDSLQVGSKEIATVDAVDSAGHALVNKGWS